MPPVGQLRVTILKKCECLYMIVVSLENNEKAQEDARMALEIDKKDIKAIMAKAESLFAGGHFELGR